MWSSSGSAHRLFELGEFLLRSLNLFGVLGGVFEAPVREKLQSRAIDGTVRGGLRDRRRALIQARFVDRMADPAERIEPPLSTLTLVEEVPDSLFDQFRGALIVAASKFLLDLLCQIRR